MKYPQLVSARAVSAISDWLVNRLEHLGVDAPLVYSRLLLSLLHTPLQINALDLAEISDINIANTGRRNNRRFSSSDTEAIKRITAIESLVLAVASDQKVSNVESLVDELCEKLREIEEQQKCVDESQYMDSKQIETVKRSTSPEDPTKRYYRAFPALSKDLPQHQGIRVLKPLTWPLTSGSSVKTANYSIGSSGMAGVKRRSKRKRNQAMSKGRPPNNRRTVNSEWDTDFEGAWEMGRDLIREFAMMQNSRNRSISESDASNFVEIKDIIDKKNAEKNTSNKKQFVGDAMLRTNVDECSFFSNNATHECSELDLESSLENLAYCSLSEIEGSLSAAPRRLYEREVSNESLNIREANNLASFEAKFNRKVEALWDSSEDYKFVQPAKPNTVQYSWFNHYNYLYDYRQTENQLLMSRTSEESMSTNFDHRTARMESTNNIPPHHVFQTQKDQRFAGVPMAKKSPVDAVFNSIWSGFAAREGDESLNPNSLWGSAAGNMVNNSLMNDAGTQRNDFGPVKPTNDAMSYRNYDLPMQSKWSDCSFEVPFIPPLSTLSSTTTSSMQPMHHEISTKTDDKIRRNLFQNSYFYDSKSLPVMNNFKQTGDQFSGTKFGTQLNTHLSDPFFEMNKLKEKSNPQNEITQLKQAPGTTLINHSKNSCFVEVKPSSKRAPANSVGNNFVSYADQMKQRDSQMKFPRCMQQMASPKVEEENLLTSERTHFRPIVNFVDGYQFNIPGILDEVDFSRSASGTLYLDSGRYSEFSGRGGDDEFKIKFPIQQNDKCVQTEPTNVDIPWIEHSGYLCDRSASESKDSSDQDDDFHSSFELCDAGMDLYHRIETDMDIQHWLQGFYDRKCPRNQDKRKMWEVCSVCNFDVISKPANQMMRKELVVDGNELLSYLWNLCIERDREEDLEDDQDIGAVFADDDGEVLFALESDITPSDVKKMILEMCTVVNAFRSSFRDVEDREKQYAELDQEFINEIRLRHLRISEGRECSTSNKFEGGLFFYKDKNIWQRNSISPADNVRSNIGANSSIDNGNWDHANLEQIWNSDEDKSPDTVEMYDQSKNANELRSTVNEYVYKLIETHELAIDSDALKRYIDFKRRLNSGNDNGNGNGFMNLTRKLKRSDRKRRHSATQNISGALDAIIGEGANRKLATMCDRINVTAIITCNYWTTDTSSYLNGNDTALGMNPTHFASRPLTR